MNVNLFDESFTNGSVLNGTIIRLPLRQDASNSELSSKTLTPEEVRQLLLAFVESELHIALLFLSHITSICVLEVDSCGVRQIGKAEITRDPATTYDASLREETASVAWSDDKGHSATQVWKLTHSMQAFDCSGYFQKNLGRDVKEDLQREKLIPSVSFAFPMPLNMDCNGRLFTYLPLPLPTNFPCHVHSLFALTPSRQNLRNSLERGIVRGGRDEYVSLF